MRCSTPVRDFDCQSDENQFDISCNVTNASIKANENSSSMDIDELCDGVAAMKQSQ